MRRSNFWVCFLGFFLFALANGSPADAMCNGAPQINLSDGSKACVLATDTTEITSTMSIKDTGPATARSSKTEGGYVAVRFLGEESAKVTTRNAIRRRAREVCASYKDKFLADIAKPGNPFMVVVLTWGNKPEPIQGKLSPTLREIYLTKNCRVKHSK